MPQDGFNGQDGFFGEGSGGGGGGAPTDALYWLGIPNGDLPSAYPVNALPNDALIKNNHGAPAAAISGVDYEVPLTFAGMSDRVGTTVTTATAIDVTKDEAGYVIGATEELLAQVSVDFDTLAPFTSVACTFSALTAQTGGATGTYYVRYGGTAGAPDGTIIATLTTTNVTLPATPNTVTGSPFSRPSGPALLKVSASSNMGGQKARLQGFQILVTPP